MFSSEGFFIRAVVAASSLWAVFGFQTRPTYSRVGSASLKMVAVDPSTVTKKEYEDICGVSFDEGSLQERLKATNFLYPKHVEVIEDIGPIAGEMVDKVVSDSYRITCRDTVLRLRRERCIMWLVLDSVNWLVLTLFCASNLDCSCSKPETKLGNHKTSCPSSRKRDGKMMLRN